MASHATDQAYWALMRFYADRETAQTARPGKKSPQFRFEVQEVDCPADYPNLSDITQDYHKLGDARLRMSARQYVRATITDLRTGEIVARKS